MRHINQNLGRFVAGGLLMKQQERVEYTLATHAIENLIPSKDAVNLCNLMNDGLISVEDAILSLMEKYGIKGTKTYG